MESTKIDQTRQSNLISDQRISTINLKRSMKGLHGPQSLSLKYFFYWKHFLSKDGPINHLGPFIV